MSNQRVFLVALAGLLCVLGGFAEAKMPTGKMVMLDVWKLDYVTSRHAPSENRLLWRELIDAGINGVHFRSWTHTSDKSYTEAEWVREAHEYGLWVAGGTGTTAGYMVQDAKRLASLGVDFIQLDEPMAAPGAGGLDAAGYAAIKNAVRSVKADTPVIISDVFYNDQIARWSGVDGIAQEVYVDAWFPSKRIEAVNFRNAHPGAHALMWVWLSNVHTNTCDVVLPDSKFNTWFNDSFDHLGKVILFIFQSRSINGCQWGAPWPARVKTIQAKTGNLRVSLPSWRRFSATSPVATGAPTVSVQVRSTTAGITPASAQCLYSTDRGASWRRWADCSCTGSAGTKGWETITAKHVPFHQASATDNLVRFKITDRYSGNYYRGPRTDKMDYAVNISALAWQGISPQGSLADPTPDLVITVQDAANGLDGSTASCEYSTDGGQQWQSWPAQCSGAKGSTAVETLTLEAVPFNQESLSLNRLRCTVRNMAGTDLVSPGYIVPLALPPTFLALSPRYSDDMTPDCTAEVRDTGGLALGATQGTADADTALLLHLDGDGADSSGEERNATVSGATWKSTETWKTAGGQEDMLHFDGVNDQAVVNDLRVASRNATFAMWVKAENSQVAVSYRGIEQAGGLSFAFAADRVAVSARIPKGNASVTSGAESFALDGRWYHVALSVEGEHARLYVNGALRGEADWAGFVLRPAATLSLGRALNRYRFFAGYLDELSIHRRVLSASEIAAAYHSGMYRYSVDGGASWAVDWTPAKVGSRGGSATTSTLMAEGVPFDALSETDYQIAWLVRDLEGNVSVREHPVRVVEAGHACLVRECGGACGDCETGFACTDGQCVTSSPDPVVFPDAGIVAPAGDGGQPFTPGAGTAMGGGCELGGDAHSAELPWATLVLMLLLASIRRTRRE